MIRGFLHFSIKTHDDCDIASTRPEIGLLQSSAVLVFYMPRLLTDRGAFLLCCTENPESGVSNNLVVKAKPRKIRVLSGFLSFNVKKVRND